MISGTTSGRKWQHLSQHPCELLQNGEEQEDDSFFFEQTQSPSCRAPTLKSYHKVDSQASRSDHPNPERRTTEDRRHGRIRTSGHSPGHSPSVVLPPKKEEIATVKANEPPKTCEKQGFYEAWTAVVRSTHVRRSDNICSLSGGPAAVMDRSPSTPVDQQFLFPRAVTISIPSWARNQRIPGGCTRCCRSR